MSGIKDIDSILQVTKDTVSQTNNYNSYIINENNSLYLRQLPLLMKCSRASALALTKKKNNLKLDSINFKKEDNEAKINNSISTNLLTKLTNIRVKKTRSNKLPPLCPLYNGRGELVHSVINTSKIKQDKMNSFDNENNKCLIVYAYKTMEVVMIYSKEEEI